MVKVKFETSVLIISFIISVILGIIIIPILRKLKVGQIERDDGPQSHLKKQGTPTMGGIIMIVAMILVVTGIYLFLTFNNQSEVANKILPILLVTIGFGLIGFIDDFKKLVLKNTEGLKEFAEKKNQETIEKVNKAIDKLKRSKTKTINFKTVAEEARVSKATLYNNDILKPKKVPEYFPSFYPYYS